MKNILGPLAIRQIREKEIRFQRISMVALLQLPKIMMQTISGNPESVMRKTVKPRTASINKNEGRTS